MDKLQDWEAIELLNSLAYCDKNSWEQTRSTMYTIAQVNSQKKLSLKDIITFPWDTIEIDDNINDKELSDNQIKKLKELSLKFQNKINEDNGSTT